MAQRPKHLSGHIPRHDSQWSLILPALRRAPMNNLLMALCCPPSGAQLHPPGPGTVALMHHLCPPLTKSATMLDSVLIFSHQTNTDPHFPSGQAVNPD